MIAFFATVFASIFILLTPLAALPVFIAFLESFSKKEKKKIIKKSVLIALLLFYAFSIYGKLFFDFLGVKMHSFKIAGGILLLAISLGMLLEKNKAEKPEKKKSKGITGESIAITPLAIPVLTGPGTITAGIMLFGKVFEYSVNEMYGFIIAFIAGSFLAYLATYLILSRAPLVTKAIGPFGEKVIAKVMGLVLLSISVQFILNGVQAFITSLG